jgi:beta-lactamase regulating signal transducer with metallopeptidase domain
MPSQFAPDSALWWNLLIVLGLGTAAIVALVAIADRRINSAVWRRTLWQAATLGLFGLMLLELTGMCDGLVQLCRATPLRAEARTALQRPSTPPASTARTGETTNRAGEAAKPAVATAIKPAIEPSPIGRESNRQATEVASTASQPAAAGAWWPAVLWALGTVAMLGWIAWSRAVLWFFRRQCRPLADPVLRQRADAVAARMAIRRPIRVLVSYRLSTPVILGIWRPLLILPARFAEQFTPRQQGVVLAHELAHLAARDPLWQSAATAVCGLLWWHPLAWWSRRRLHAACEAAADEASLVVPDGPRVLAESLVALGRRLTCPRPMAGVSIEGPGLRSGLGRRVEQLLNLRPQSWRAPNPLRHASARVALPVVLVLAAILGTAWAPAQAPIAEGETRMSALSSSWRCSLAATTLFAFAGCGTNQPAAHDASSASKPSAGPPAAHRLPFTISKETTYISEPLRADGYPDYLAAWNRRMSQGVTPDNNAAVLFWKAMGPGAIPKEGRDKFFKMLGIASLPEEGDYCINSHGDRYVFWDASKPANAQPQPDQNKVPPSSEQEGEALRRPWSKAEFPAFADWLEMNKKPLDLIVEASQRPRRYQPWLIVAGSDVPSSRNTLVAGMDQYRACIRWLCKRAMLRLHDQELDKAWADIMACHRLARAEGLYVLVGATVEAITIEVEKNILQRADLTAEQVAKMRRDRASLSPMPTVRDLIDIDFRFETLKSAIDVAREGADAPFAKFEPRIGKMLRSWSNAAPPAAIDWDSVLRLVNARFDQAVAALGKGSRAERKKAINAIVGDDLGKLVATAATCPPEARSNLLGRAFLVHLTANTTLMALADVEDRKAVWADLMKLAFALAAYHADHNSYPSALADLTPKYISEVPKDVFSDADLHYSPEGDGYLLYSVGVNGKDEGGKGPEEWTGEHFSDDLVIRVPAKS